MNLFMQQNGPYIVAAENLILFWSNFALLNTLDEFVSHLSVGHLVANWGPFKHLKKSFSILNIGRTNIVESTSKTVLTVGITAFWQEFKYGGYPIITLNHH